MTTLSSRYVGLFWEEAFGTPEDAVLAFKRNHPELLQQASEAITWLFDAGADESARARVLDELGWGYAPAPGRLDDFLRWIQTELSAAPSGAATG